MNQYNWSKLSREERADVVVQLYQEYGSIRKVASVLGIGSATANEYLIYSRIPSELGEEYGELSFKAFIRAYRTDDLKQHLEQERAIMEYSSVRRRIVGLEKRREFLQKLSYEVDNRKKPGE